MHLSAVVGAEESLLSDRNNNEIFIINLATVPADGILIPGLHKCVAVIGHFKTTLSDDTIWEIGIQRLTATTLS